MAAFNGQPLFGALWLSRYLEEYDVYIFRRALKPMIGRSHGVNETCKSYYRNIGIRVLMLSLSINQM